MVPTKASRRCCSARSTAKEVADEWAAFLTKEQQKWMAKNKK